jgi:hypothetical protein
MAFDVIARIAMGQINSQQFCNSNAQLAVRAIQRINNNRLDYFAWIFPWIGRNLLHPLSILMGKWTNEPIGNFLTKITEQVKERKKQREIGKFGNDDSKDFIDFFLDAETMEEFEENEGDFGNNIGKVICQF